MKKLLFFALVVTIFFNSCILDDRSPIEKANELLKQRGLMTALQIDSIFDYNDSHSCLMAAYNLQWKADSILLVHQSNQSSFTSEEKKEALELSQTIYDLKVHAAKLTMEHKLAKDEETFVGYSVFISDSLTGETRCVYFDKDLKSIRAIDRSVSY